MLTITLFLSGPGVALLSAVSGLSILYRLSSRQLYSRGLVFLDPAPFCFENHCAATKVIQLWQIINV